MCSSLNFSRGRSSLSKVLLLLAICLCVLFSLMTSARAYARAESQTITILIVGAQQPPGFSPSVVTAQVGDTLAFQNASNPPATYTIVASDNSFHSPPIAPGGQSSATITTAGDVAFSDPSHSLSMLGALHVVSAQTPLFPTPNPTLEATAVAGIAAPGITHVTPVAKPQSRSSSPLWGFIAAIVALVGLALLVGGGAILVRQRVRKR